MACSINIQQQQQQQQQQHIVHSSNGNTTQLAKKNDAEKNAKAERRNFWSGRFTFSRQGYSWCWNSRWKMKNKCWDKQNLSLTRLKFLHGGKTVVQLCRYFYIFFQGRYNFKSYYAVVAFCERTLIRLSKVEPKYFLEKKGDL